MSTPALNPLVTKIRSAYPGVYDDMDDATLTKSVLAKYPQYSDLAAPKIAKPSDQMEYSNQTALREEGMTTDPKMGAMMNPESLSPRAASTAGGIAAASPFILGGRYVAPAAVAAAKKHPILTQMIASEAISQARNIPYVGKFIPPYSEWLPFFLGGRGKPGTPAPEGRPTPEPAINTDQVPGRPYQPNPRYQAPPTPEPLPQQRGPFFLKGEVQPQSEPTLPFLRKKYGPQLEQELGKGLGAAPPPEPNKPIYQRPPNMPTPESRAASDAAFKRNYPIEDVPEKWGVDLHETPQSTGPDVGARVRAKNPEPTRAEVKAARLPEGHTPVESNLIQSYKYDPTAKEFEIKTKNNDTVYRYGDVPPEDVQAFEKAESKATAWSQIKRNPLVAKKIGGQWQPVKPVRRMPETTPQSSTDLTDILTRSVQQAKAKK